MTELPMSGGWTDRTAVLIGGSGGIGRAVAAEYAARGWSVLLTGSRDESTREGIDHVRTRVPAAADRVRSLVLPLDDPDDAATRLDDALQEMPPMRHFVWLAGRMPGEESWSDFREAARVGVPVNLTAAALLLGWAAERLEDDGDGRLVVVGSVSGDRARKGSPAYGAAKAGLHALADGLRHRLHGTGVGVTTVRPGWVAAGMLSDRLREHPLTVSAERAARALVRGAEGGRDIVYVGWWWRWVGLILKAMPAALHKRFAPS